MTRTHAAGEDPGRAGRSGVIPAVGDLDEPAGLLTAAGVRHDGPTATTSARVLQLSYPAGKRVVLTGQ